MTRELIRNATIVTGDGRTQPFSGDVLIDGDRIAALGAVTATQAATADRVVDAAGRTLAPSFVDTHNHGALGGTAPGASGLPVACELAILGGVTKRICGVDGLSPAPVAEAQRSQYAAQLKPLDGAIEGEWTWSSIAEFLAWHRGRSATDMGLYLGHSAVRRVVMANVARVATDAEIAAMAGVVRREAPLTLGLSTGLVYNPAVYSDEREIAALVRAFNDVKPGALFPHLRSESDAIIASAKEVIGAAIEGGGGYCNEHSKIAGKENYDRIGELEGLLGDAASLAPTMENMYPYTAGSTTGDAIFPPEMRAGGRAEFLAALADPAARAAMIAKMRFDSRSFDNFIHFCGGLGGIQIAGVKAGVGDAFLGRRLSDVARAAGVEDPESEAAFGAVFDFVAANAGEVAIISHYGNDATVERFFAARPWRSAPMDSCRDRGRSRIPARSAPSPRRCVWRARWGSRSSRWCSAWRRCPAASSTCPIPVLRAGADASLVLFDAERVRERNDYLNPEVRPEGDRLRL